MVSFKSMSFGPSFSGDSKNSKPSKKKSHRGDNPPPLVYPQGPDTRPIGNKGNYEKSKRDLIEKGEKHADTFSFSTVASKITGKK